MQVDFKRPSSNIKYLSSLSSESWLELALSNPIEILIDHAHCERKAAGVAIQLMFRYPSEPDLAEVLSPIAREELEHLEKQIRYTNSFLSGSVSINPNVHSSLYLLDNIVRISHFKDSSKNLLNHIYKMLSIITK